MSSRNKTNGPSRNAGLTPVNPFSGFDIPHLLESISHLRAETPFLIWAPFDEGERSWTTAEFSHLTACLAGALAKRGIRRGDRVLICLQNCPEFLLSWFACARLGCIGVLLNPYSSGDELAYFAEHADAVAAITQPKIAPTLSRHCGRLQWVAITETDGGTPVDSASAPAHPDAFETLLRDSEPLPLRPPDPTLPISIQYTSGTTARPKGVVMTHANALWAAKVGAAHEHLRPDDVFLVHLPLYHVIALFYSLLPTLWTGATAVLTPRFSASRFWELSLRYRCTWTSMVPFCVRALSEYDVPDNHSYRMWGNAFWDHKLETHFGVHILGWYGMTELITHPIVGEPYLPGHTMAIGRPAPEYELAVLHEDGSAVGPGETGDLLVRGTPGLSLFAQYLDNPQATAESFNELGFFKTEDRVTVHSDGFITFADRAKDMLKVGGENVATSEIERVLMGIPGVREAAVVGKSHPLLGDAPVAFVTTTEKEGAGSEDFVDSIRSKCHSALARFKVPHDIYIIDHMPRGSTHKISKAELKLRAAEPGIQDDETTIKRHK